MQRAESALRDFWAELTVRNGQVRHQAREHAAVPSEQGSAGRARPRATGRRSKSARVHPKLLCALLAPPILRKTSHQPQQAPPPTTSKPPFPTPQPASPKPAARPSTPPQHPAPLPRPPKHPNSKPRPQGPKSPPPTATTKPSPPSSPPPRPARTPRARSPGTTSCRPSTRWASRRRSCTGSVWVFRPKGEAEGAGGLVLTRSIQIHEPKEVRRGGKVPARICRRLGGRLRRVFWLGGGGVWVCLIRSLLFFQLLFLLGDWDGGKERGERQGRVGVGWVV
ncbi:hypothetical protein L1887_56418 [Cichorium endivia]|nr:hypothetical protein L1887_56418 [Cichorium endivia]